MATTIVIGRDGLGQGSEELGRDLMGNFLRKLWAAPVKPDAILFYNSGVKLLARGSPSLDAAEGLAQAGVDLIACGTCVKYFALDHDIMAGRIGDMQEIVSRLMNAERTISL